MKRMAVAVLLLAFAISLSAYLQNTFYSETDILIEKTQSVLQFAQSGDKEKTKESLSILLSEFKEIEKKLNKFLFHSDMENIEINILALEKYLKIGDLDTFKACCVQILDETENLRDSLKLSLKNIL